MARDVSDISNSQYELLRRLLVNPQKNFDEDDANALIDRGFALKTPEGRLSVTESGRDTKRVLGR